MKAFIGVKNRDDLLAKHSIDILGWSEYIKTGEADLMLRDVFSRLIGDYRRTCPTVSIPELGIVTSVSDCAWADIYSFEEYIEYLCKCNECCKIEVDVLEDLPSEDLLKLVSKAVQAAILDNNLTHNYFAVVFKDPLGKVLRTNYYSSLAQRDYRYLRPFKPRDLPKLLNLEFVDNCATTTLGAIKETVDATIRGTFLQFAVSQEFALALVVPEEYSSREEAMNDRLKKHLAKCYPNAKPEVLEILYGQIVGGDEEGAVKAILSFDLSRHEEILREETMNSFGNFHSDPVSIGYGRFVIGSRNRTTIQSLFDSGVGSPYAAGLWASSDETPVTFWKD